MERDFLVVICCQFLAVSFWINVKTAFILVRESLVSRGEGVDNDFGPFFLSFFKFYVIFFI